MKKYAAILCIIFSIVTAVSGCGAGKKPEQTAADASVKMQDNTEIVAEKPREADDADHDLVNSIINKYKGIVPEQWSQTAAGVKTKLDTKDKVVALTFDACGGKGGSGYDQTLIDYLIKEKIPATLFINSRWIDENFNTFMELASNSLFEIENHGTMHRPLSVAGKSAYNIAGTKNITEVIDEIKLSADKIYELTGRKSKFFRAGTNYYDEVAVKIASDLGEEAVGYSVLGDAGATYTKAQIITVCSGATPGSIILCHMNHPEKETAAGIKEAASALRAKGFRFVKLEDYPLK